MALFFLYHKKFFVDGIRIYGVERQGLIGMNILCVMLLHASYETFVYIILWTICFDDSWSALIV